MLIQEWIRDAVERPIREEVQSDGRIRGLGEVNQMDGKFLSAVLLADGETVHNAFFDRRFRL